MTAATSSALCGQNPANQWRALRISLSRRRSYSCIMICASSVVGLLGMVSLLDGSRDHGRYFRSPLVVAFLIGAGDYRTGFQRLFHQIWVAAARTCLGDRFAGRGEFAFWIVAAAVKCVSFARLFLHQFAVFAQRALHADEILFHVLAIGISAAGGEFPIAPMPDHQIAAAFGANFVEGDVRNPLALIQAAGGFAIRIPGAS